MPLQAVMFFDEETFRSQRLSPQVYHAQPRYDPEQPWLGEMVEQIRGPDPPKQTLISRQKLRQHLKQLVIDLYNKNGKPVNAESLLNELTKENGSVYVEVDIKLLVLVLNSIHGHIARS